MYEMPKLQCDLCKTSPIYTEAVNLTNGCEKIREDDPNHDGNCICGASKLEVLEPAKTHTCSCGNVHTTEPTRYKIPNKEVR